MKQLEDGKPLSFYGLLVQRENQDATLSKYERSLKQHIRCIFIVVKRELSVFRSSSDECTG